MKSKEFVRSLMEFNKRVLEQGHLNSPKSLPISELKQKLMFNKIFISNMEEIFQKHKYCVIENEYRDCMKIFNQNIENIIKSLCIFYNIKIIDNNTVENRIESFKWVDQIMVNRRQYNFDTHCDIDLFDDNYIHYVGMIKNHNYDFTVGYVDPKRSAYSEIIKNKCNDNAIDHYGKRIKFNDSYLKNDTCIANLFYSLIAHEECSEIRVTRNLDHIVTKIEYNGSENVAQALKDIFGSKHIVVIENKFMYLNDIERILDLYESKFSKPKCIDKKPVNKNIIDEIFDHDILMEYPKNDFDELINLIYQASDNPSVKFIFMTMYRIGNNPALFYALKTAVDKGKFVHIDIELLAFGEAINAFWKNEFLRVGVSVSTFGISMSNKVHCKFLLIGFNNGKCIAQIGTGNYNANTTSQYTDFSLLTSDEYICDVLHEISKLLRHVPNRLNELNNNDVLVTKYNARRELIKLIDREASKGADGYISIKVNALDDDEIINALSRADKCGCKMDLMIRGVCTWIPDNMYDNIVIKSTVWDKLEHSRVYCFGNVDPDIYIGSLDPVTSKLDKRIELLVKIKDPNIVLELCKYLNKYVTNTNNSWIMVNGGQYIKEN